MKILMDFNMKNWEIILWWEGNENLAGGVFRGVFPSGEGMSKFLTSGKNPVRKTLGCFAHFMPLPFL